MTTRLLVASLAIGASSLAACSRAPEVAPADTLLVNGHVYTFSWDEPAPDGAPAASAPHAADGWRPDSEAVAVREGRIVFVGTSRDAETYRGPSTRVIDLAGATAIPGLVDSHAHIFELGQMETDLDLTGVATEAEAVDRVVAFAATVPKGEWIVGRGWDEGAWASRYPTMALLQREGTGSPRRAQVGIHAIGDAGNRETLDFIQAVEREQSDVRTNRNRIEHAQVVHPDDFARYASQQVIASMEPPHAVEDKAWAEDRLGAERVTGAYAWRTFRQHGVKLIFNSDLTGSDHNIFYGLHSAITRRDKSLRPAGGWHPEQRMTPEEAVRGYSTWAAFASFTERETGVLAPGRWADITVMDIDPLVVGATRPDDLLKGGITLTMVGGTVVFEAGR